MQLNSMNISIIRRLLSNYNSRPLHSMLKKLEVGDLTALFTQLNKRDQALLTSHLISVSRMEDILVELPEGPLEDFLKNSKDDLILQLLLSSKEEACAQIFNLLSKERGEKFWSSLDENKQKKIEQILSYPENSAGRMMDFYDFNLDIRITVGEALDFIRERAKEKSIYYIYCVNKDRQLQGVVSLRELSIHPLDTPLESLVKTDMVTVYPEASTEHVAKVVSHYNFIAIPVVTKDKKVLGIITVDDVVDLIQEQVTANTYAQAGLQKSDRVYSDFFYKFKNRLPWMFLNLLFAILASSVVSFFEETMQTLIILASVKNIVAGMAGNTAIQTLTVATRGLATEDFQFTTKFKFIFKEFLVGAAMGLFTGLCASMVVYFWKGDLMVTFVIFISMLLNSLVATFLGAVIPLLMNRFRLDPAIGSGVVVTMFTDIFSFFSFLGIASLFLVWWS